MTGDTANGRSMSVIKVLLPRNWNLAIAQAAATPNTRLRGTRSRRHQQGELDRRPRHGIGDGGEVCADAFGEGLDEYREQRQHQEQAEEQRAPAQSRAGGPTAGERRGRGPRLSEPCAACRSSRTMTRDCITVLRGAMQVQFCNALMPSMSARRTRPASPPRWRWRRRNRIAPIW